MKETGATGASILAGIMHFAVQIEPLLNLIVGLFSVVSGALAIVWWVRRFRNEKK